MLPPPGIFVGISPVDATCGDAVVNYRLQDGEKNNAPEGEKFITRENKQAVAEMETVVGVPGYNGSLKASDVIQTVSEFFSSIGNAAENEELGSVILRKRGIKDDISHGIGREKVVAFMAVPDVLKHGKVVDYQENWKGRGYDTAVVAAPIKISGEDYIAGVCVKRASGESRFYVHEVLPIKEGATPFNRAALKTSVDSGGDTPSMNNILFELLHVKEISRFSSRNNPDIRYSSRDNLDSEYLELAKDPEVNWIELDEMVRDAAEKAGFVYKRNTRRKHAPANAVPWQMFVKGIDNVLDNYGEYTYYATDAGAIPIGELMPRKTAAILVCIMQKRSTDLASRRGPIPRTTSTVNRFYRYCTQIF